MVIRTLQRAICCGGGRGEGFASVRVSPGISPRSLQVSDLLLLVAEWAGYSVSSTAGPATLVVEGERVPFSISRGDWADTSVPSGRLSSAIGAVSR